MMLSGGWQPYSGAWPRSGSMRNGVVFERPMSAPVTAVTECSFWPTAMSIGEKAHGQLSGQYRDQMDKAMGGFDQADTWPTPRTISGGGESAERKQELGRTISGGGDLQAATEQWPSPQERDYRSGETVSDYGNPRPLNEAAVKWATPRGEDSESCGNHPGASDSLTGQTKLWLAPHGQGGKDKQGKMGGSGGGEFAKQAMSFQDSPPALKTSDGLTCWCGSPGCVLPSHKRKLNPIFETWLMGWPLWWLTSAPEPSALWGMASYLFRQRSALSFLLGGPGFADSDRWPTPRVDAGPYSQARPGAKKIQTNLEYVARDWTE